MKEEGLRRDREVEERRGGGGGGGGGGEGERGGGGGREGEREGGRGRERERERERDGERYGEGDGEGERERRKETVITSSLDADAGFMERSTVEFEADDGKYNEHEQYEQGDLQQGRHSLNDRLEHHL